MTKRYTFGDYTLDTELYELYCAGQLVKLERIVFNVLSYLIEHRDRVVSRDELLEKVYGGERSNATIDTCINAVRRAVGDNGKAQHTIQTARGRGWRFVAPATPCGNGLASLRAIASFSNQIWTLPALPYDTNRDIGAEIPRPDVQRTYALGSYIRIALDLNCEGYLLLLDEGTSGKNYCICPSWFARDTRLQPSRSYLPQTDAPQKVFPLTGKAGREYLLAVVTESPLELDWLPPTSASLARTITPADIETLFAQLRTLEEKRWRVLYTYFDVTEPYPNA